MKRRVWGEPGVPHDVDANVVAGQIAGVLQKPPDAAADVDDHATRAARVQQLCRRAVDRCVAFAITLQSTLDGCRIDDVGHISPCRLVTGGSRLTLTRSTALAICGRTTDGAQRAVA